MAGVTKRMELVTRLDLDETEPGGKPTKVVAMRRKTREAEEEADLAAAE